MKIGIVAEGPSDLAVLENILKGSLGIDTRRDVRPIRPELAVDETDINDPARAAGYRAQGETEYSNWLLVLDECKKRSRIEDFISNQLDEERIVVVHIDTAEAELVGYDVARPADRKSDAYTDMLRELIVAKINGLLGQELAVCVRHAVAVEETDAWVLTIYDIRSRDTARVLNAKKELGRVVSRRDAVRGRGSMSAYDRYNALTVEFRNWNKLATYAKRNRSLMLFIDSLR